MTDHEKEQEIARQVLLFIKTEQSDVETVQDLLLDFWKLAYKCGYNELAQRISKVI